MRQEINIPKLGAEMHSAEIVEWFKAQGEAVTKGESLCEINAEKMTAEVEALYSGTLAEITGEEGESYDVGAVIGYIEDGN